MSFSTLAGLGGIGFVLVGLTTNLVYARIGLPLPVPGETLDRVTGSYARIGDAMRGPSVFVPFTWLCTTVFAVGVVSALWRSGSGPGAWALVGFAGVLMQNATFTTVEALRFGIASAASRDRGSVAGLWGLSNALFGFNQVFLAVALLGFTAAGASARLIPDWQAWLGYGSAALLFLSSLATPYNVRGASRASVIGLTGWLGWLAWIVSYSIVLLRR